MKKRKEKRFELRLSDEGAEALDKIVEATGLSKAAVVELVLREEVRRRSVIVVDNGRPAAIRTAPGKSPKRTIPDNGLREALAERKRLYPDASDEIVIGSSTPVESWRSGPIPKPGKKGKK